MYYYCEGCGIFIRKPEPFTLKIIPAVKIGGKLYCPGCVEHDEETDSYKPKEKNNEMQLLWPGSSRREKGLPLLRVLHGRIHRQQRDGGIWVQGRERHVPSAIYN